tara:strand:- start:1195 stop:1383 length:189 start_codon:yes stop_codon:yes gene_type:complete
MWVLVFVYFYDATPYVEKVSQHRNIHECFYAREALSEEVGKGNGYFLPEQQAICINMNETKL